MKPIWDSVEWKETRARLLKDHCEECGKSDAILMLTHTKSAPSAKRVGREIRNRKIKELLQSNVISAFNPANDEFLKNSCPSCKSFSLRERKMKKPRYVCNTCTGAFEEPVLIIDTDNVNYRALEREYYWTALEPYKVEIDQEYNNQMEKIRQWYISGEDTRTLCKSCAYNLRKGRVLCKQCKEKYHDPRYEVCFNCNSSECNRCGKRILKGHICECDSKDEKQCKFCGQIVQSEEIEVCDSCVLAGKW
ncbi:MAG: hypothetical protein INQ03_22735 [Candidatus Heimdallarchaeota archaeon]|nr:hypothetical protein [Candidatus Heimdallarchaeota archaeon]